jgi:hypothetical protein
MGGGVEICHREFITDVTGSTAFSINNYNINPGLSNVFPWLASVTQNFEEYEMKGLVFEYRPSSGSAVSSTSSALGTVIMATDYNVISPNFVNKQQMESYEFSTSVVPFNPALHPVECAPGSNPIKTLYVRDTAVPDGADARMYDLGNFQIATVGMQSAYTVGELWVTYHLLLKKPRSLATTVGLGNFSHFVNSVFATGTPTYPFGNFAVATPETDLANVSVYAPAPDNSILFSFPGTYMVIVCVAGTATLSTLTIYYGANLANSPVFSNAVNSVLTFGNATLLVSVSTVTVLSPGSGVANTIRLSLTSGSALTTDLYVFPTTPLLY